MCYYSELYTWGGEVRQLWTCSQSGRIPIVAGMYSSRGRQRESHIRMNLLNVAFVLTPDDVKLSWIVEDLVDIWRTGELVGVRTPSSTFGVRSDLSRNITPCRYVLSREKSHLVNLDYLSVIFIYTNISIYMEYLEQCQAYIKSQSVLAILGMEP